MKKTLYRVAVGFVVTLVSGSVMANGAAAAVIMMQSQNREREQNNAFYQAMKSSSPVIANDGFVEYPNFFKIGPETRFCKKDEVVFKDKCYTEVKEKEGIVERVRMKNGNDGSSAQDMLDMEYGKNKVSYAGMGVMTRPFNVKNGQYYDSIIIYYKIISDKKIME